jgi:hypothetical protein
MERGLRDVLITLLFDRSRLLPVLLHLPQDLQQAPSDDELQVFPAVRIAGAVTTSTGVSGGQVLCHTRVRPPGANPSNPLRARSRISSLAFRTSSTRLQSARLLPRPSEIRAVISQKPRTNVESGPLVPSSPSSRTPHRHGDGTAPTGCRMRDLRAQRLRRACRFRRS